MADEIKGAVEEEVGEVLPSTAMRALLLGGMRAFGEDVTWIRVEWGGAEGPIATQLAICAPSPEEDGEEPEGGEDEPEGEALEV